MKVERRFKKKKKKKPKEEALFVLGEWTSGGEESSTSSSDESNKTFTTCFNMGTASSSNICLMAKGIESDVSDDDSDSPSYEELLDLVHEHQRAIKKQSKNVMFLMILILPLLQIMIICCANSNCLARSMKSSN